MTVNVEVSSVTVHGNGTKTGYTFPFSWTDLADVKIFYTPFGQIQRQLGAADFKITPGPGTSGVVEFLTITPAANDIIKIERITPINQNIDYVTKQKVDYNDVQFSFDKLTRIVKEASDILDDIPCSLIPDPTLARKGQMIVTDGSNSFMLYPFSLDTPLDADDGKILMVDVPNKTIKFISSSGSLNPAIPQNVPTHKYLENKNNTYVLGPDHPDFLSSDIGYAEIWDGTKFAKAPATGINNPPMTTPIKGNTVLTSKPNGSGGFTTEWVDDTYKTIAMSSGVIKPCAIVRATDTTINITAGSVQIVQDTVDVPTVEIIQYAGSTAVAIPTTVGETHLVYLDFSTPTPSVIVQVAYERLPRGRKIFIGEVEHTHDNIITNVSTTPTIVSSLASQLRQLFVDLIGNIVRGVNLTGTNPNTIVLGAGSFIGWGSNFANDALRPHNANLAAKNPALFRWRDALGRDSAEANSIDTATLQTDDGAGTLTPVPADNWIQVLVWIYPDSSLVLQYPNASYATSGAIPSLSVFLDTVDKDLAATRNAAPVAVINIKQGGTFADHQVFILSGFFSAGSATTGDVLPSSPGIPGASKILYIAPSGLWAVSPYTLQVPTTADEGLSPVVESSNFVLGVPRDSIGRTWLSSGILDGFTYSFTGQVITIAAGHALFCIDGTPGSPTDVFVLNYAGTAYTLPTVATQEVSYVYIDNTGALTATNVESKLVRGNKILLFRVEHGGNTVIEGMQPLYYGLNAVPEQVKEIFEIYGNSIKNFQLASSATNVITHAGGVYYGFSVGSNANPLTPHRVALASQNPLHFKFVQTDGIQSSDQTSFPATPKVELTPNTLTDLVTGSVAYYPIWIFPSGRTIVQYANQVWVAGAEPDAATIWLTFPRDGLLQTAAYLAGFVKWEGGKDFTSGNTLVNVGVTGASGGGVPVIPAGPTDKNRLYIVGDGGTGELGPYLDRPKTDGSDLDKFADRILEWSSEGDSLEPRPDIVPRFQDGLSSLGDHLISMQNGVLTALTNRSDYVDASLWTIVDMAFFNVYPAPTVLAKKGFLISKMTRNDAGGGLGSSIKLRLSDVFTGIDFTNFQRSMPPAYDGTSTLSGGIATFDAVSKWSPFFPTLVPNTQFLPNPNKMKVYNNSQTSTYYIYEINPASVSLSMPNNTNYSNYVLSNTSTDNIDLSFTSEPRENSGGIIARNSTTRVNFDGCKSACIFDLTGKSNLKITIEFVDLKFEKVFGIDTPNFQENIGLKLWTSSSSPITDPTYRNITSFGTPDSTGTYTVPIGLKTTVNAGDVTVYHQNASDVGAQTDQYFYYGYALLPVPSAIPVSPAYDSRIINTRASIIINIESLVPDPNIGRYEFGTLASLNTLPAEAGKVWDGPASDLAPGKIFIVYYILFPKLTAVMADFDPNLKGILLNPFTPDDVPSMFLENQTGNNKYTERIEAKRRKTRSVLLQVYELDCTAEQFNNWKLTIYHRSALADAAFKQLTDKVGASLWLANESDIPL